VNRHRPALYNTELAFFSCTIERRKHKRPYRTHQRPAASNDDTHGSELRSFFVEPGETVRFRVAVDATAHEPTTIAFGIFAEFFTRDSIASLERHWARCDRFFIFNSHNPIGVPTVYALNEKDLEHGARTGLIPNEDLTQLLRYFRSVPDEPGGPFNLLRKVARRLMQG
jgi:hypothetical protein